MNPLLRAFIAACLCLLAHAAPGAEPTASQQLVKELARLQSLDAAFEQVVLDARGMVAERTHGRVLAQRPGRFRWVSEAPFAQELVSDGDTLWFYDPDLAQVTVRAVDAGLLHTPALLLSGDVDRVVDAFHVRLRGQGENDVEFELTPKDEESLFDSLVLGFHAGTPRMLEIVDALGQRTRIVFSAFTANPTLAESSFHFESPEDVDVIRD
ncbi:MAG: outer membrane lipoprotein chaperone LolA [Pseudomonadales bacterium]